MIPSSRHSRRSQTNDPGETFELTSRAFGNLPTTEEDLDEYLDPDSDASLLERHLVHEIDDESFKDTAILKQPHLFRRFLTFMSHTPLISRFSGVQSYGALPTQDQGSSNDLPKGASSDVGTEDNIKGKLPLLRPSDSTERLRSGQEANEDTARNRFGSRSKNAGPVENAPHDDNIVDIEDGTSSWSDENPPDNSKLVKEPFTHNLSRISLERLVDNDQNTA